MTIDRLSHLSSMKQTDKVSRKETGQFNATYIFYGTFDKCSVYVPFGH